jgi:shikimate kinase
MLDPAVRKTLADASVVWLQTDQRTRASRVRRDNHLPLLGERPLSVSNSMARYRSGLCEETANVVVHADHEDVGTIADCVLDAVDHGTQHA